MCIWVAPSLLAFENTTMDRGGGGGGWGFLATFGMLKQMAILSIDIRVLPSLVSLS